MDYELTKSEFGVLLEEDRKRRGRVIPDAERWVGMVAEFHATRHTELRETDGSKEPRARPSERWALNIYGSHFLFEVTEPAGWGNRLVNLVTDGAALTWDLPGYGFAEAKKMATLLVDGYV